MSDEWPLAPRLERALQDEAASAQIDPEVRKRLADRLAGEDSARRRPGLDQPSHQRSPRVLAVAAALIVLVSGVAVLTIRQGRASETATSASPPLTCELTTNLNEYRLGLGEIIVGAKANQPPDGGPLVSFISLADASTWHDVAEYQRLHEHLDGRASVIYSAPATAEVADSIIGAQCTPHIYLIVEGMSAEALDQFVCSPETQSRGVSGLVLVGAVAPPTRCEVVQPVLLLGPDILDGPLQLWEQHLGCTSATTDLDSSLVRPTDCRHTLRAGQTTADLWGSTIDELPTPAWVLSIAKIAN